MEDRRADGRYPVRREEEKDDEKQREEPNKEVRPYC
jgi:hypothetical protein